MRLRIALLVALTGYVACAVTMTGVLLVGLTRSGS